MKQKLTHNLNLKVLAVLFSIIIWVIVVNIDDPVKSVQFNDVAIQPVNELYLKDKNLVYEFAEGNDTVDVTVTGRRSVIEDLSKDNINVYADFKEISDDNTVPLTVSSNKYSGDIDNVKCEVDKVQLEVEELKKIQKAIQVETVGLPAFDYITGDYAISLNRVNIEGPKSVIDMVQSAKVQVDVDGATNNISASVPIILFDGLGERVDLSRIKMNLDNISVSQEILYTKNVAIVCNPFGDPESGYKMTGKIDISPSEIKIAGPKSILDNINSITIPSTAVNITNQNTTYTTSVNLFNYFPSGVGAASDDFNGNVNVSVDIEKEINKVFNVYPTKISQDMLPSGLEGEIINGAESIVDNRIELSVHGLTEEFTGVTASDIKVEVDYGRYMEENGIEKLMPGTYSIPLKVTLPNGLETEQNLKVRVKITDSET
ncbi:MAG: hypothetical protein J5856_04380 [Lachnospiraceae bacterium]|nr:hypothetical protein [Lachnospiraceae bacterium]